MFGKMDGLNNVPESPMMPQSTTTSPSPTNPPSSGAEQSFTPRPTESDEFAGLTTEQIAYLKKFSWSAFWLAPVWAIANRLYGHAIVSLIFGQMGGTIFMGIYLGANGRRAAWKKGGWSSFDEFRSRQTTAAHWVLSAVAIIFLFGALSIVINAV